MRALAIGCACIALSLSGCLRVQYDLCEREDPHPECDAGVVRDAAPQDGGELDGGPPDAGSPEDSGVDAEAVPDAG